MPEGPEVRLYAELINEKLSNRTIESFEIKSGRYARKKNHTDGMALRFQ